MPRFPIAVLTIEMLLVLAGPPAAAAPPIDCKTAVTTPELNYCADLAFQAADAKLNAAYKKLLAFIKRGDGETPYDAKSWERALRASQTAWIAFRDADCGGLVPMSWGGGTGTTSAVLGCKTEKTEIRTKELIAIYKDN